MTTKRTIVGWREYVDLPEWGVFGVLAKIDTGARTSALHVDSVEEVDEGRVRFEIVLNRADPDARMTVEADLVRTSKVKPSSGDAQERPVVATTIRLGGVEKEAEISLVCRKHMLCRMLVGRSAIGRDFLVDPSAAYEFGRPARRSRTRRARAEAPRSKKKGRKKK